MGSTLAPPICCKLERENKLLEHRVTRCEGPDSWRPPPWMKSDASSLWDLKASINGKQVNLSNYKAKAAIVVNVASCCDLQLKAHPGLKRLLAKYGGDINLLAFPCDQFGAKAPGSSSAEREYMYKSMDVTPGSFPVFDKVVVNGPESAPVFNFLKNKKFQGDGILGDVAWNYEMFLVNGEGMPVERIPPCVDPVDKLDGPIRDLLGLDTFDRSILK